MRRAIIAGLVLAAAIGGAKGQEGLVNQPLNKERCDAAVKAIVELAGAKKGNVEQIENRVYKVFVGPPIKDWEAFIYCIGAMPPELVAHWHGQGPPPRKWLAFVTNAGAALTGLSVSRIAGIESRCREKVNDPLQGVMGEAGILMFCGFDSDGFYVKIQEDLRP